MGRSQGKRPLGPEQVRMSFGEHLEELRWRIIKLLIGAGVATAACLYFGQALFLFLCQPLAVALRENGQEATAVALSPPETFVVYLKMSFLVGLIISCPYGIYQIWQFVAAGLYTHEKKTVQVFGPFSLALFIAGVLFCFYVVIPISLNFLIGFSRMIPQPQVEPAVGAGPPPTRLSGPVIPVVDEDPPEPQPGQIWLARRAHQLKIYVPEESGGRVWAASLALMDRPSMVKPSYSLAYYISFVTTMALAFGIGFQVPIVVIFLAWSGIATVQDMKKARRYVLLALVTLAAVLTPPDVQSQILLAVPMWGLYELGLILARIMPPRMRASKAQEGP